MTKIKFYIDECLFNQLHEGIVLRMLKEKRPDVKMISKPDPMPEFTLKHLRHESEAWKRLLNFMLDENVLLKYRLAEVLKNHSDPAFLEEAEKYPASWRGSVARFG